MRLTAKSTTIKHSFFLLCLMTAGDVSAQQMQQQAFPLSAVHLLSGPFLEAERTDMNYMLKLDPDRLLAPYLREAGLPAKAKSYGNWESDGLDGHTAGHYLTALAQMYAASDEARWKHRLDHMVDELKRCQDARSDGYVGGVPGGPEMWAQVKNGDFSLFKRKWVPWYNLHKLFAGLRDAYLIGGNAVAKEVLVRLSDWTEAEVAGLTEQQMQGMLNTEYGGMNEVLADVAVITGSSKYLTLAQKFNHQSILAPLEVRQDKLNGLHANTQIPKIIGFERIALVGNYPEYDAAARFFWETVVKNRSISIGGNSFREHFNPADNFEPMLESEQGPETCNSYNMLKLTEMLFLAHPDATYMDYYERTLFNHILSSQEPGKDGGFVYFTPIRPRHYRVYSKPDEGFWCCVGTGMENHGKYGEMIYSHKANDLYVNLFMASTLNWREKGITVTQSTGFPFKERTQLQFTLLKPSKFKICIRRPQWVNVNEFVILVNGMRIKTQVDAAGYAVINQRWKTGDKIDVALPMQDHFEYLPDHSAWASVMHGPIVLAAATDTTDLNGLMADGSRFGHIAGGPLYPMDEAPLLVDRGTPLNTELKPIAGKPLNYTLSDMIYQAKYGKLVLKPFFQVHDTRYMLYWPVAKQGDEGKRKEEIAATDRRVMEMVRHTVDQVAPGEQQPESDHFMQSSGSATGIFKDTHWRSAQGFLSYKMKVAPDAKVLQLICYGKDRSEFDVYLNDAKIGHVNLDGSPGEKFITQDLAIPETVRSYATVIVKFLPAQGASVGPLYGIRIIR